MISKVAAPLSSPRKLERKAPCIQGVYSAQLGWKQSVTKKTMGPKNQNCLESMVEPQQNGALQDHHFFLHSIAREFLGFIPGSSEKKQWLFFPYSSNGRSGYSSYTHRGPYTKDLCLNIYIHLCLHSISILFIISHIYDLL